MDRLNPLPVALFVLAMTSACAANAQTASIEGRVWQVLVSEDNFGGCMITVEGDIQDELPSCKPWWMTLDCNGDYLESRTSEQLLEQARLAYSEKGSVRAYVDDSRRHNGYCLAYRIDLLPPE